MFTEAIESLEPIILKQPHGHILLLYVLNFLHKKYINNIIQYNMYSHYLDIIEKQFHLINFPLRDIFIFFEKLSVYNYIISLRRSISREKERKYLLTFLIILSLSRKSLRNPINSVGNYLIYNRIFFHPPLSTHTHTNSAPSASRIGINNGKPNPTHPLLYVQPPADHNLIVKTSTRRFRRALLL